MFFFFMRYDMTMTAFRDLGGGFGGVSVQGLGVVGGGGARGGVPIQFQEGSGTGGGSSPPRRGRAPQGFPGSSERGSGPPKLNRKLNSKLNLKTESKIESKPGPKLNSICLLFKVN